MTFGSLFAGIGGMDLGLERAGMQCRWQVEIDPWRQAVLTKHWPNVPKYGDIRELTGNELEPVDLIAGGFPCQPVSLAGRRKAQQDERWLFPNLLRLVRLLAPRWLVLENVPGLLTAGMGEVLGQLAVCGYDAEWDCLSADSFGAEHRRTRVFIVAYPMRKGLQVWSDTGAHRPYEGYVFTRAGFAERTEMAGLGESGASRWRGDVHGIPQRMDRIKALGDAVVPQVAEWIGRQIMRANEAQGGAA